MALWLHPGGYDHPALINVGAEAAWLWARGLGYSSKHRLNGRVPFEFVRDWERLSAIALCGDSRWAAAHGPPLWVPTELGYRVSNYMLGDGQMLWRITDPQDERWSKDAYPIVYARDGKRCRYCGRDDVPMSIDHIRPRVQGGGDHAGNLVVACKGCNSRKWGRTPEQAGMVLLPVPEQVH